MIKFIRKILLIFMILIRCTFYTSRVREKQVDTLKMAKAKARRDIREANRKAQLEKATRLNPCMQTDSKGEL